MTKTAVPSSARDRLIRLPEVLQLIPVSRSAFYAGMKLGIYPKPKRIGKRTVAWSEAEAQACIAEMNRSTAFA